ncbi:LOW QUALITY PROTEIN: mitochondrial ribonuclease P catalytic subunit [Panulirus ornatus]|uniref:LOW QUALITY PROTEIN: mitochondrial ribonuclease P catalytic subunit n=1 Tax=Panulirus ornatus TaxID=150431 RepID=UPI003A862446
MALQRCLLGGRILWPAHLHFGGLAYARHIVSWHSEIRVLNIEIARSGFIKKFSLRICGSGRMQTHLKEIPRNFYSSVSKITTYSEDDPSESDVDNEGQTDDRRNTQLASIFENRLEMSSPEWEDVIQQVSQEELKMNAKSCDVLMMRRCKKSSNYPLATSYLDHIEREGRKPNLATLGVYLELCGETVTHCGEKRVLEIYHQMCSQVKMLDSGLSRSAILGLTSTGEWKQAVKHLPVIRKMSQVCRMTYSAIITAAFRNGDYDFGWKYLETMCQEEKVPLSGTFLEWLRQCDGVEETEEKKAMAFTLLHKLSSYEIFPDIPVIQEIERFFRESLGWSGLYVKIPSRGRCPACRCQLEGLEIDREEFNQLQEEFAPRVLRGSDIFLSSSPKEWADFQSFVEEHKPFTVVVDGLNVAYCAGNKFPRNRGHVLKNVVEKVLKKYPGGHVLVIGRQHMTQWLPQNFHRSKKTVSVYTLNDLTRDDGFFIYAALQSGLGTKVISSDMLRDHLFRLGEAPLRDTFRRWQRMHQIMAVSAPTQVQIINPAAFSTTAQGGDHGWHIPYDDGSPRQSYELPKTWLCLQSVTSRRKRQFSHTENIDNVFVQDIPFVYEAHMQPANSLKTTALIRNDNRLLPRMKSTSSRDTELRPSVDYGNRYPSKRRTRKTDQAFPKTYSMADVLNIDAKD